MPCIPAITLEIELDEPERSQGGDPDSVVVDDEVQGQAQTAPSIDELDFPLIVCGPEHVDPTTRAIEAKIKPSGPTAIA